METMLEMKCISKTFPGVKALDDVAFIAKRGEIHGLVGENGAGKSTLMKILAGACLSDTGSIKIEGELIKDISPHHMIKKGVAVIYQELMLSPHMTVAENIFLGAFPLTTIGLIDYELMKKETIRVCGQLGLDLAPEAVVKDLSVAKRQMVEIAKALSRDAKIIVLDEPTAVLGESELKIMFGVVRKLAKEGVTFIYISHRLKEVFELVDTVTIMKDGRIVITGNIKEFDMGKMIKYMVGRENIYPKRDSRIGKVVLNVKGITRKGSFKDINFSLHEGEILAISGLAGSGRTEILRAIIGADPIDSGEIEAFGKTFTPKAPKDSIKRGLGIIPEDRKIAGLFMRQSILFNISITMFKDILKIGFIDLKREREKAASLIRDIRIKTDSPDKTVRDLSGGNQQKVILAKWLNAKCKILLVDEPTRGVDVGAKFEIYSLLGDLIKEGAAIIMVSSELPEVLGFSDRIIVMWQGNMMAELDSKRATEEQILQYATGMKRETATLEQTRNPV